MPFFGWIWKKKKKKNDFKVKQKLCFKCYFLFTTKHNIGKMSTRIQQFAKFKYNMKEEAHLDLDSVSGVGRHNGECLFEAWRVMSSWEEIWKWFEKSVVKWCMSFPIVWAERIWERYVFFKQSILWLVVKMRKGWEIVK